MSWTAAPGLAAAGWGMAPGIEEAAGGLGSGFSALGGGGNVGQFDFSGVGSSPSNADWTKPGGGDFFDRAGNWLGSHGKDLSGALGAAGKAVGDVNQSKAGPMPQMGKGGGVAGISRGQGPNLNQLVQLLLQRQQGLYPGGGSSGQPQPAARTQGLLGF